MSTTTRSGVEKQNPGQLNSVQLNIVTLINMERATATGSLSDAMYMMDNSIGGKGQGTSSLETVCKQGQVINWIVRPIDMEKRLDGTWPPMPKINNIVFLDTELGDEEDVAERRIFNELKIYGMPDRMRGQVHARLLLLGGHGDEHGEARPVPVPARDGAGAGEQEGAAVPEHGHPPFDPRDPGLILSDLRFSGSI